MTYIVNAWLERDRPQLKVMDKRTGQVLVDLDSVQVRDLLEAGEFSVQDFAASDAQLQETVRELFLKGARGALVQGFQR